jgi:DHA3 family macrolide efflux protein-like MFS transporter
MIGSIMTPVGMTVWGPLADVVRIDWLLIVSGTGILGIGAFFISDKILREAGILKDNERVT